MHPLAAALRDRKLQLLGLISAFAVILGFVAVGDEPALKFVLHAGYWVMLVLTGLLGWALWSAGRTAWLGEQAGWRENRWPLALVAACGTFLLVHESFGFKILMDEVMLLGSSMSMHLDKTASVPVRGNDLLGAFQLLDGQLDKRPLLHPFLASVLHDLTGYRPENAFVLNTVLTYVLLGVAFLLGRRLAGAGAGTVLVLLLTGLPLLAQNATGGGFELLNLVLIFATTLLGLNYAERRDAPALSAFILCAVALANTRYESVLFLGPVGLLILWVWWREGRATVSWGLLLSPLLLVTYAFHRRIFFVRDSSWELGSQPGYDRPFSISYVGDNFDHWLNFFFNTTGEQSNSLLLSVLGFLAVPFFLLWLAKALPRLSARPPASAAWALLSLGFLANALLYLCYFWGKFDDPVIRRLSLPLNAFLALATVTVAAEFPSPRLVWRTLAALAVAGLAVFSLPAMARHGYTLEYYVGREMEWRREFIAAHPERDYLFIDNNAIIWITHRVSATPAPQALRRKGDIAFNLRNRTFSAIYVFQRFNIDPATGRLVVTADEDLGPDYQLESVWERRFTPMTISRISRVVSIREGPLTPPEREPPPLEGMSAEQKDRIRQEFFNNYIKRLP